MDNQVAPASASTNGSPPVHHSQANRSITSRRNDKSSNSSFANTIKTKAKNKDFFG